MGSAQKASFKESKANCCSADHCYGTSFLVRSCKGWAFAEKYKASHIFEDFRGWPVFNRSDLARVHAYFSRGDNHPQILHFLFLKVTFLRFEIEVVLLQATEHFSHYFVMML